MIRYLGALTLSALALAACATPRDATRNFIVFFNYDSAELSGDARSIVLQAATVAKGVRPARIDLAGYLGEGPNARTDGGLTAQRFAAVEETLVDEGVERGVISRVPLMDTVPLPATAVRRVEIRIVEN